MATTTKSGRSTAATTTTTTTTTVTRTWAERRPVARWLAVLPPLVGLPVLFGLGMGPTRGSVEDKLAERTNAALAAEGITGLEAWARGRDIHFRGNASPAEAARAAELARDLQGVRTVFTPRGATGANSDGGAGGPADAADTGLAGLDAAASWRDGKLVLSGSVGSEEARAALLAAAADAVGAANVVDELRIDAALGEADLDRVGTLGTLFSALAERGGDVTARLSADGISLAGSVPTGADKDALDAAGQQLWDDAGLGLINNLTIAGAGTGAGSGSGTSAAGTPTTAVPAPTTQAPVTSTTAAIATTVVPTPTTTPATAAAAPAGGTGAGAGATPAAVANQRFVVYFDVDADLVNTGSQATLAQAIAAAQAAAPGATVTVTGFADSSGPAAYNLELSQRRAARVRDALVVANGAIVANVDAKGVDSSVTGDLTPARRVEIVFG